ncbi:MAG TPA: DUF4124 domain-containing protein [Myxococcaceae bacterium]|nr:DUF4124 domain-containing protein [Myxococcaceae bacterium]
MSCRLLRASLLVLALHAGVARADDIYVWTDASGETHYTNDVASIPERSRKTARKLDNDPPAVAPRSASRPGDGSSLPKAPADEPPAPRDPRPSTEAQPPPPEPIEATVHAPRDDETLTEDQWRTTFRKANERVSRAERKVTRTRDSLSHLPGQDFTTTYDTAGNLVTDSRYQTLKLQLEDDEYQLNVAREELHDLERAAAREAIPLEWRR